MKKLILPLILASALILACKKEADYCVWLGLSNNVTIKEWPQHNPSNAEIQQLQDSCSCTIGIIIKCYPCEGAYYGTDCN